MGLGLSRRLLWWLCSQLCGTQAAGFGCGSTPDLLPRSAGDNHSPSSLKSALCRHGPCLILLFFLDNRTVCYEDQRGPDRAPCSQKARESGVGPGQATSVFPLFFLLLSKIHRVFVAPAEVTGIGWDKPVRGLRQRDKGWEKGQQV